MASTWILSAALKLLDHGVTKNLQIRRISKSENSLLIDLIFFISSPLYNQVFWRLADNVWNIQYVSRLKRKHFQPVKTDRELVEDLVYRGLDWIDKSEGQEKRMTVEVDGVKITFESIPNSIHEVLRPEENGKLERKK